MHAVAIVSRLLDATRAFLKAVAARPEVRLTLVKGDAEPEAALRAAAAADRLWFEGDGPLLEALATAPDAAWLPRATLHVSAADLDADRLRTLAPLVGTVVVEPATAAPDLPEGMELRRAGDVGALVAALAAPGGDLTGSEWEAVLAAAAAARGTVRIEGDAPRALRQLVETGYGRPIPASDDADTVLAWAPGQGGAAPGCTVGVRDGAPHAPPQAVSDGGPLVTAIVFAHNAEQTLGRCLASLRAQTWPHLEILVVDDGSTDGTRGVVDGHLHDARVRYLHKPHSGRPESRNLGLAEARGEWVAWLGADDEALPGRIAAQVRAALATGADVVHADGALHGPDGRLLAVRRYRPLQAADLPARLLAGLAGICPILDTTALVRVGLYDRLGAYDPAFARCQDYDLWVRAALAGDVRWHLVPVPLVRVHRSARSGAMLREAAGYCHRIARKLLDGASPEALAGPLARRLHWNPQETVSRRLLATAEVYGVAADHPLRADAAALLAGAPVAAAGA